MGRGWLRAVGWQRVELPSLVVPALVHDVVTMVHRRRLRLVIGDVVDGDPSHEKLVIRPTEHKVGRALLCHHSVVWRQVHEHEAHGSKVVDVCNVRLRHRWS